jgi:hypothetical protein
VGGGHGIVRQILDLQYGRAADAGGVLRPFCVRQIITPLREPGAQRRVSPEPGGRGVDGSRIAEIAPAGPTSVWIDAAEAGMKVSNGSNVPVPGRISPHTWSHVLSWSNYQGKRLANSKQYLSCEGSAVR